MNATFVGQVKLISSFGRVLQAHADNGEMHASQTPDNIGTEERWNVFRWEDGLISLANFSNNRFPTQRVLVFVDGDFWHGYRYDEWRHKLSEYWRNKIEGNRRRDRRTTARLRREGWIVVRLWEHDIHRRIERCAARVEQRLLEAGAAPRRSIS